MSITKHVASRHVSVWKKVSFAGVVGALSFAIGAADATAAPAGKPAAAPLQQADTSKWNPKLFARPPVSPQFARRAVVTGGLGKTVPFWTMQITSPLDGGPYTVSMVGSSPYDTNPKNTHIVYVPIALRIHIGGFVIDPTAVSHCDTQSAAQRFFNSPIFVPAQFNSNGVNVSAGEPGGTQLISAFQRANFWNAVKGTHYGVTLVPSQNNPIVVDWTPTDPNDRVLGVRDNCGGVQPLPLLSINEFDNELQAIAAAYAQPEQIPVTLALDTAIYVDENRAECCVLGYHNAVPVARGTQLYAVGAYFDTNHVFGPDFADTTIWTHELAELVDDPFVQSIPGAPGGFNNDLTPAWGHTGQVFGCQNNLEAGDPLTPDQLGHFTNYPVVGAGGFVYHMQDLPFHDWFYRTPSSSTGGKGSFFGNLPGGGQPNLCS
jgi:hypothetical protein